MTKSELIDAVAARGELTKARAELVVNCVFDTMIEVIDPRVGAVLARERLKGYLIDVTDHHQVSIYAEDQDGNPIIRVIGVTLVGRGG